jgi:predicted aspartyl protease
VQRLRSSVLLGAAALASISALAAAPALAGVTVWVPLEVRDGRVLFPVEVAGVAGHALFDTGSQGHSISTALVERAGLKLAGRRYQIRGVSSTDEIVGSVSSLPIKLFGVDFKLRDVPALPHSDEMIIGAGFLKAGVLQLDYPNSRMRLITHDSVDLAKIANVPLRLEEASGLPTIQVTIDGKQRWMLLDTGNAGPIVVRRMLAAEGNWIERFKRAESAMTDVNANVSSTEILVLPSVVIGPFELTDVPVAIPAAGESINISGARSTGPLADSRVRKGVRISGVVGYEILRHFIVTLDYDREKLHIAAPAQKAAADPVQSRAPEGEPQSQPGSAGEAPAAEPPPAS